MKRCIIYSDGGARGNPGPAAGAAVLFAVKADGSRGEVIGEAARYFPHATNNVAEYTGIIEGIKKARDLGFDTLDCRMDSELACKQLNGQYKVKNPDLGKLFLEIYNLKQSFKKVTFSHVRREQNKEADALVNRTIDRELAATSHEPRAS